MDILILNWKDLKNPDVGGAEIILYEMAKRLVAEGHTVTWFCRSFKGSKNHDTIDGIRIVRRGNRFSVYLHAYIYYKSLTHKPDRVIDCVNTICWQTPLYVPRAKRVMYVNQLAREVFFYELPPIISHVAYAVELLEFQTYRSTKVLCYAPSVKADLMTFGIPQKNIHHFPIGIDHKRYIVGKKSNTPLFIFVARLTRMKRPQLCVEAMKIIAPLYPNATLAIVGYGPQEHSLRAYIRAHRLEKNVRIVDKNNLFFKSSPKDQKIKLMQSAWALLLPSVKEGWGLVVTEAGACGTPAIGTNVTGICDSIIHGKTGTLLSANPSAQELASAMIELIGNSKKRTTLSKYAKTYAEKFSWGESYARFKEHLL